MKRNTMNPENNKKVDYFDKLWNDYLELSDNYKDDLTVDQFGAAIIMFASRMLYDCAPNSETAFDLIRKAVIEGHNWSVEEKEKSNES